MASASQFTEFKNGLSSFIPDERIISDYLRRLAYGTDASFYRLTPELVIKVRDDREISEILKKASLFSIPVTFRGAGTSLSGQAVSDSVMLKPESWEGHEVIDEGMRIRLQPGVIGGYANLYLAGFQRKLGPDPASINSATIGGIAANNASGMTSGTAKNIYNTLHSMKIVFADGFILDTADEKSRQNFLDKKPDLLRKLKLITDYVNGNTALRDRIIFKYRMKNTTGYGLNSLTDFTDPFDIIMHLMIGSEGTLGFISELTLNTVPDFPNKTTSLILFPDIHTACSAIPIFEKLSVDAAEIMDRAALKSVEDKPGMPDILRTLPEGVTALLVETSGENSGELDKNITDIIQSLENLPKISQVSFTKDKKEYKKLWDVRKGLFPSVCKSRPPGTSVIIEDVNFPLDKLADAALDLREMFAKFDYPDTIIWGHSLSGNLHFVFSPDFSSPEETERYKLFMEDLAKLVIDKYDGSLKAEHGTGRNMAPFVKYEWGDELYEIMLRIKNAFDPQNILNPGVLINSDPEVHLRNLKPLPVADPIVDQCIECGFCEVNCPSKELTLSPRQRITVFRELVTLEQRGSDNKALKQLFAGYDYQGEQTCATDGLCALSCPVDIDTGKLIKELRYKKNGIFADKIAWLIVDNFAEVTSAMKVGIGLGHKIISLTGEKFVNRSLDLAGKITGLRMPVWNSEFPLPGKKIKESIPAAGLKEVVYFPACINRSLGNGDRRADEADIKSVVIRLFNKAGYNVLLPEKLESLCCGMPFSSKGFKHQGDQMSMRLADQLMDVSENGRIPVIFDMSPCHKHFLSFIKKGHTEYRNLIVYDQIEGALELLLPNLKIEKTTKTITIHTTCSSRKEGLDDKFKELALALSNDVIIPAEVGCCGWAGDRGFTYPELNASALRKLKPALAGRAEEGYSTSRTCEIGLSLHSGISYRSILYLLDEVSG
ncbi:MAG: FAD-binding oxidoreductase [Ignavibacteriales bacterium]|nr:FAD-binding oxidoreductase [Ignavibacteriales bacterium]MCF8316490.1 FAD-binding oxidoreductase [Ignavibacteriales bacterium]MCF8437970.1 FAD-binding oxidoreductase [Ignavibacteriales bacterium]